MKFLFILMFFSSKIAFAASAIVIVFQAPLLKEANSTSQIKQYLRKGDKIYISNDQINSDFKSTFFKTFDRAGNIAYIQSNFVKPITNDEKEYLTNINFSNQDPTDYRIEEPIPNSYPFNNSSFFKTSISLSLGSNLNSPYSYSPSINKQSYSSEVGAKFLFLRHMHFDLSDRFYFGAILNLVSSNNNFTFSDATTSEENRFIFRLGPIINFDCIKTSNLRFTIGTGFTYNFHRSLITRTAINNIEEERIFNGFSISPVLLSYLQFENIFNQFDIILGSEINFYLPFTQTADSSIKFANLWNGSEIKSNLKPQANLFIGTQFKY